VLATARDVRRQRLAHLKGRAEHGLQVDALRSPVAAGGRSTGWRSSRAPLVSAATTVDAHCGRTRDRRADGRRAFAWHGVAVWLRIIQAGRITVATIDDERNAEVRASGDVSAGAPHS
jgi:hypothetical protein